VEAGELYLIFTDPLEALGLEYFVTGSVASSSYGEPRYTHDLDLVLVLPPADLEGLAAAFSLPAFYCPPLEVLRTEASRKRDGHFNLIHQDSGFKADVYVAGDDPLHRWALAWRKRISLLPDRGIWLAPPEYVIVRKLQFFDEGGGDRHLRDIRSMLEVSGDVLDRTALDEWIDRLRLRELWDRITAP
jgi:hypothetical protein